MIPFEFTCTHVAQRPELLFKTINSLTEFLVDVDFSKSTIYINIDSTGNLVPELEDKTENTVSKLNDIFGKVVFNNPETPNFSNALKWCWTQPKNEFFFHIEDDWLLKEKIETSKMLEFFNDPKVHAVNLRAYHFLGPRPCLLQSIWRKSFCAEFVPTITPTRNPENQLRSYIKVKKELYNVHYPEDVQHIVLKDIGREWLNSKRLKRNQISSKFIFYQKDHGATQR